jgi:hypothetical protein
MHQKVFLKLKNPKSFLFWANMYEKKKKKKTLGWIFLKKPGFFLTLAEGGVPGGQGSPGGEPVSEPDPRRPPGGDGQAAHSRPVPQRLSQVQQDHRQKVSRCLCTHLGYLV